MGVYDEFLKEYIDAWNRQDIDALVSFFTDDVVYIDQAVGVNLDRSTVAGFLTQFIGNYPVGFKVTPKLICEDAESERLAYEWDVEGSSTDGVKMFIKGVSMLHMRGQKVSRNVDYWDYGDSPKVTDEERKKSIAKSE